MTSPMSKGKWQHSSESLVAFFLKTIEVLPEAEKRKMFGYPCAFVNGQMFTGLFEDKMFLRLSEADRTVFQAMEGSGPFEVMPGRAMREYSIVPPALMDDQPGLDAWLVKSYNYAKELPGKEKRGRKRD